MESYEVWLKALRAKLAEAAAQAKPLAEEGRFDDAEKLVRAVNGDIYGAVALGDLYTAVLTDYVRGERPDRARAEALYERALRWRCSWPSPHTAEEAARERSHAAQVEAELKALLDSLR